MRLGEFERLRTEDQLLMLYQKGVFVGKRELDGMIALLYQVETFYVEVIYKKYRAMVHDVKTSESTQFLELYLPVKGLKI